MALEEHFYPLVLHLDDLEEIVGHFRKVYKDIEISTEKYRLTKLDSVKDMHTEILNKMNITAGEQELSLELSPSMIRLYARQDSPYVKDIFDKVSVILRRRRISHIWLVNNLFSGLLAGGTAGMGAAFVTSSIAVSDLLGVTSISLVIRGIILLVLGVAWSVLAFKFRSFSIIYLYKRTEPVSLWRRNKDLFGAVLFAVTIGALIGLVITVYGRLISRILGLL